MAGRRVLRIVRKEERLWSERSDAMAKLLRAVIPVSRSGMGILRVEMERGSLPGKVEI